jgi:CopG family transcriptional regulator, nickel-responsive regulator
LLRRADWLPCAAMTDRLVRFGVAMEASLLEQFDQLVTARGATRSEAFRDLARAAIQRAEVGKSVEAVATFTLIYDHHVRDLTERLTELQHELGDRIRSTLHVHLDHDHCLEIIVMHGRSDLLKQQADRILAIKGVLHGAIEIFPRQGHPHAHPHPHGPGHAHSELEQRPSRAQGRKVARGGAGKKTSKAAKKRHVRNKSVT